jgi:hypothetical protein
LSGSNPSDAGFGAATLVVLSCGNSRETDAKLARLAEKWGIRAVFVDSESGAPAGIVYHISQQERVCLAASAASLARLFREQSALLGDFLSAFPAALFYGFDGSSGTNEVLSWLTGTAQQKTVALPDSAVEVSFSADLPVGCEPLRGSGFRLDAGATRWRGFPGLGGTALIKMGELASFVSFARGGSRVFLLAGSELLDVAAPASPSDRPAEFYAQLAPWLMFLRSGFGEWCWHNPNLRAAWVIDDPLLKENYGFLRYSDLVEALDADDVTASIAFIPWNRGRNSADTIALFRSRDDRLSVCVHGCDHTENEFGSGNPAALRAKARTAVVRMEELREREGLAYEPVMVFPQGGFCKGALEALAAEGFLAALNTSVFAADHQAGDLVVGDLLDPAISRYGRCPLFSRKYPVSIFPVAFDLFVGKPALLVEHHGFFRNGCRSMTDFVRRLKVQSPSLIWSSPGEIFTESALQQKISADETRVRFYADRFLLQNVSDRRTTYRLQRTGEFPGLSHIWCDGEPLEASVSAAELTSEVALNPGEVVRIEVPGARVAGSAPVRWSLAYRAKVAARRYLSEFRDNYVARNEWLLSVSKKLKRRVSAPRRSPAPTAVR